jgi:hypothetical protein
VIAVLNVYPWHKSQQLFARMPRCPEALVRGIQVYEQALNAIQSHDIRAERERMDAESEQRARDLEMGGQHMRPAPKTRLPTVRRPRPHR